MTRRRYTESRHRRSPPLPYHYTDQHPWLDEDEQLAKTDDGNDRDDDKFYGWSTDTILVPGSGPGGPGEHGTWDE